MVPIATERPAERGAFGASTIAIESNIESPLGLYIHIPFCARKCPYCDFNTYAGYNYLHARTVQALASEIDGWHTWLAGRTIDTVFLGGGTPTVLNADLLTLLFHSLRKLNLADGCEITCEANPSTVDLTRFTLLRALGVNRLSLGVQSFQADELRFLGRNHSAEDAQRAFDAARTAGFDNISLDFIFGLPDQPLSAWRRTLDRALALQPEHLSLYSLLVEARTPLHRWVQSGRVAAPNDDEAARHFELAMERLAANGYCHYEISNWARTDNRRGSVFAPVAEPPPVRNMLPGWASRHNLIYWQNQEYIGVGPGAHSHLRTDGISRRWSTIKPVVDYIRAVEGEQSVFEPATQAWKAAAVDNVEVLDAATSMGETMMLGLRLIEAGVSLSHFAMLHGRALGDVFSSVLHPLIACGLLEMTAERVRLTRRGVMVGNQVFARFLAE